MYWLRAGVPTSNCPSGESPTYEGMICSPSAASTSTFPSTSAATSELVVPRSMPTMMSAMVLLSCRGRHAADDLHHGGIEWPVHTRDLPHIKSPQQIIEALPCQQLALHQGFQHWALTEVGTYALQALEAALGLRQATRKAVADIKQLSDQFETGLSPGFSQ